MWCFLDMSEMPLLLPRCSRAKCVFSGTFVLAFALVLLAVSLSYWLGQRQLCEPATLQVRPYVSLPNFLPDTQDIALGVEEEYPPLPQAHRTEGGDTEALTALSVALKLQASGKAEKAHKVFEHALALAPRHPDVLNHYGEFLESGDVIRADHLYVRALTAAPGHARALANRRRTTPTVDGLDEAELDRIDRKRAQLVQLNAFGSPALKRVKKEIYFQHIYHTVALEGNTMSLAETRTVVETRMSVPGKSVMEHNEVLGLESALRYINQTLVNQEGPITVFDILAIHKRVLGHVDPIGAGAFRQAQVFVGEYVPPLASEVTFLMEEFVAWLDSAALRRLHPVKQAALAHWKLVHIHPFVDGNGRTARLLMNLLLMRSGYPPVIIRRQDRAHYYSALQLANEGDARPFVRFIARATDCTLNVYLHPHDPRCLLPPAPLVHTDIIAL